jgi:hypothetical protein
VLAQPPNTRGGGRDHGGRRAHLKRVVLSSRPMAVPAVVYLVVNLISYPALERINASVFTAISQLKAGREGWLGHFSLTLFWQQNTYQTAEEREAVC